MRACKREPLDSSQVQILRRKDRRLVVETKHDVNSKAGVINLPTGALHDTGAIQLSRVGLGTTSTRLWYSGILFLLKHR